MEWRVPYMWEGADVWIIGGGPSIPYEFGVPNEIIHKVLSKEKPMSAFSPYMEPIHKKHVIGINGAFLLGNWIEMMFFGDLHFFKTYHKELKAFPGLRVTCQPRYSNPDIKWLKVLKKHKDRTGISNDSKKVCWNQNSGAASISIAANAGAKRIILLGFDMKRTEKKQQWFHSVYSKGGVSNVNQPPFERHKRGFIKIKKDAEERGIEIINASPESTIKEFRKCSVKELIQESLVKQFFNNG